MSTLNRLELTPATASAKARWKKIVADHAAVDRLFVLQGRIVDFDVHGAILQNGSDSFFIVAQRAKMSR